VETHSEHLLNRLRLNSAKDISGALREQIQILFVEQRGNDWRATVRALQLDEYGGIADWPDGFFDSTQEELQALANISIAKMRNEFEDPKT
ncbi:MAG: DUF3696 domain-containing protein, partial [Candidatus Pacebacteria bacterium]|nr:DUF3696 domain-containing protein [Candidatus Paceibacterota bacterium]